MKAETARIGGQFINRQRAAAEPVKSTPELSPARTMDETWARIIESIARAPLAEVAHIHTRRGKAVRVKRNKLSVASQSLPCNPQSILPTCPPARLTTGPGIFDNEGARGAVACGA